MKTGQKQELSDNEFSFMKKYKEKVPDRVGYKKYDLNITICKKRINKFYNLKKRK
jgi:hypothetical protein